MKGINHHRGTAVAMYNDNINTDQIIPSREMKRVSKSGLSEGLFANLRYLDAATGGRKPDPEFCLNQPTSKHASVLISASNFGCGSSREHAVWALHEYGFRVIIAISFGSIFFENCINNGIVPIALEASAIAPLLQLPESTDIEVDLLQSFITANDLKIPFELNKDKRQMLIDGSNAIDLTLKHKEVITQFLETDRKNRPWVYSYKINALTNHEHNRS